MSGEHVSLNSNYSGSSSQKWLIAPISPNSSEFYIINKETGYPLIVDGNTIKSNTSGITDDRQRFSFGSVNGDYFQILSASSGGCFYILPHIIKRTEGPIVGYYYSLCFSTDPNLNDDYSYFKLAASEDISGSGNISTSSLVYQPNLLYNIPEPLQLPSYTYSALEYCNETVIGESWVPFTLVKDNSYSPSVQITQTPFYKMIRTQSWKKLKIFHMNLEQNIL